MVKLTNLKIEKANNVKEPKTVNFGIWEVKTGSLH